MVARKKRTTKIVPVRFNAEEQEWIERLRKVFEKEATKKGTKISVSEAIRICIYDTVDKMFFKKKK